MKKIWVLVILLTLTLCTVAQAAELPFETFQELQEYKWDKFPIVPKTWFSQVGMSHDEENGFFAGHRYSRLYLEDNLKILSPKLEKIRFEMHTIIKRNAEGDNKIAVTQLVVGYKAFKWLTLEAGQMANTGLSLCLPPFLLRTINFPLPCKMLHPEELGVKAVFNYSGFQGQVGLVNGTGINRSDNNKAKDVSILAQWTSRGASPYFRAVLHAQHGRQPEGDRTKLLSSVQYRPGKFVLRAVAGQEWFVHDRWGASVLIGWKFTEKLLVKSEYAHLKTSDETIDQYMAGFNYDIFKGFLAVQTEMVYQSGGDVRIQTMLQFRM